MQGKRVVDLALVLGLAPVWVPLVLAVAIMVRLRVGTPVLFRQIRAGLKGCPFQLLKFRTMTIERDASGKLLPDAQRLTPFGRWLRRTSLDELPEFINVLRGEMSLVGPRPLLMEYLPRYSQEQSRRHEVLPGLTGWAQIHGRNGISWPEKFELDVWYVNHRNLRLDWKILALTVGRVVLQHGISAPGEDTMPEFQGNGPGLKSASSLRDPAADSQPRC